MKRGTNEETAHTTAPIFYKQRRHIAADINLYKEYN